MGIGLGSGLVLVVRGRSRVRVLVRTVMGRAVSLASRNSSVSAGEKRERKSSMRSGQG